MIHFFKTSKITFCLALAIMLPRFASAFLVGPYTPDTNTLFLLHFDESAGGSVTTNIGSKGGNFYTVTNTTTGLGLAEPPPVTTLLGYLSYTNINGTNFGNAVACTNTDGLADGMVGYDGNKNGAYDADTGDGSGNGAASPDAIALTNLNIGNGGVTSFTLEALICPTTIAANQEIICTDNSNGGSRSGARGFQFKITSTGQLQFNLIGVGTAASFGIPTTGTHKFVSGSWYHVAAVYNGTAVTLYWTQLDPSNAVANSIGSLNETYNTSTTIGPLDIGGENRGAQGESFKGLIDEVRISKVARAANGMQFFSPTVTISPNPVSQKIDNNQPVTFTVSASSLTALGYQWRFNGTNIPGATAFGTNTSSYSIAAVNLTNAGSYDCIVTNISGNSATSSPAILVVGAGNFLSHRYSFTADTTDSIGGATGTNFADATVSGGALILDGTTGTYMQLPGGLFQGVQAATFDFWATYGMSGNNEYVFDFGNTNGTTLGVGGQPNNYLYFSPHSGTLNRLTATPGTSEFEQTISATGILDGTTVHVTCVVDPPDKRVAIYTNGVLEVVNTNYTVPFASLSDQLAYIGSSLTNGAYLNANIDELRIYNGALSASSVLQSDQQGPNTVLSDGPVQLLNQPTNTSAVVGLTASFSVLAGGHQPVTFQWYENGSPVAGATNASYSFTATAGQNGHTFQLLATNNVTGTNWFAASTNATLTLITPPTLGWLGQNSDTWDISTLNWTNTSTASLVAYADFDGTVFNDLGSSQPTVDLVQTVNPVTVTVNSATVNYTFISSGQNGALGGGGSLIKNNTDTLIMDVSNNMTGPVSISGGILQVGNGDSFGTLGSGPVTNNATLSLNRADATLNVANAIHGAGTLSIDGSGSVTISGASDYTGSTLVNSGILNLQSGSGLGATNGGTTVASGAQLYITANANVGLEGLTLNGSGDGNGALRKGGAGLTTYNGAVTLASAVTIGVDAGATLTLSNAVTGAFALTKNGNGTLSLNSSNSYSGGTMLSAGIIGVNANGDLGIGTVTAQSSGTAARFVLGDGVNLTNPFVAIDVSPGVATGLLMVNDNTNGTMTTISGPLTFDTAAANGGHFVGPTTSGYLNVSGVITMPDGNPLSIRFGNMRFSGVGSSYTEIQVRANTTSLGANNGIATNAVMDLAGNGSTTVPTYFDLNGFSQKLAGLKNAVTPANVPWVTNSSNTTGTLTLDLGAANSQSFGGSIVGNLSLVLSSGSQTLSSNGAALDGLYTYTGNTVINGGTLVLGSGINLSNTPVINIAAGATLDLSASPTYSLTASNTLTASGTASAATINGASGGVINLPGRPIILNYDGSDPALTISIPGGNLVMGNNAFTVNTATPLAIGTYTIATVASGSIIDGSPGSYPAATGTAIGAGKSGAISVSGVNVVLTIATASTPPPVAGFAALTSTNVFVTQSVTFTNLSTGSITNWVWNFGDGTIVTNTSGVNVSHQYNAVNSYTVSLTVVGAGGANGATNSNYIVVKAKVAIGKPVLSGGQLILSGVNGPAGQTYRIVTSTNIALAVGSWTPVVTNVFAPDGSYAYTNSPLTNVASFFKLVSP